MAAEDFRRVVTLDPNNNEAKRELESIQRLIDSKAVVDIKPIDKPIGFQSNKPLTKVSITEKNVLNISTDFVVKLPQKVPKNYYQFECDWRQLIGKNSLQLRVDYLQMIGPEDIRTLLTSTLEPQMMSDLLNTICHSNDSQLIYAVLSQMSKTPRFDTIVLFLSQSDQKGIQFCFRCSQTL